MKVSKGPWNFTTWYAYAFPGADFIFTKNSVQRNKLGRAVILIFFGNPISIFPMKNVSWKLLYLLLSKDYSFLMCLGGFDELLHTNVDNTFVSL